MLKHHVVSGKVPSSALQNNMVVPSLLGTPLRVKFYESEKADWTPLKVPTRQYSSSPHSLPSSSTFSSPSQVRRHDFSFVSFYFGGGGGDGERPAAGHFYLFLSLCRFFGKSVTDFVLAPRPSAVRRTQEKKTQNTKHARGK